MSHQRYEDFDHRTTDEIRDDQIRHLRGEAIRQLSQEGKIGLCGTDQDFRDRDEKIGERMAELAKTGST